MKNNLWMLLWVAIFLLMMSTFDAPFNWIGYGSVFGFIGGAVLAHGGLI